MRALVYQLHNWVFNYLSSLRFSVSKTPEGMKALLLFLLVTGTAKWSESMTLTPYTEDDCSGDDAIRYDGDFFYQGMKVNEHQPHVF